MTVIPPTPATAEAASDGAALGRCVKDVAAFLDVQFGRQPVQAAGIDPGGYADLLALDHVDHMVTTMALRAPAFRLVREGGTLSAAAYTRSGRIGSKPVDDLIDVGRVTALFDRGATIVLQGLHRYWPPVTAFCRELELGLGHPIQANAYLTPPVSSGLELHADAHDVFALQTHGRKRWVVHPPDGQPWDLELVAGDALYLPRGTRHAAQTVAAPSLHLTVGVRTTTWRDLVRRAMSDVVDDADLDLPLPAGWHHDPARLGTQLSDRLATAAGRLRAADGAALLSGAADGFTAGRVPPLVGALRDVLEVDQVDHDTRLRRRAGSVCRLAPDGDRLVVVLGDRRLTLPIDAAPAMTAIADRRRLTGRDLDGLLDRDSQLVLVRRLVREGLLTVDRA